MLGFFVQFVKWFSTVRKELSERFVAIRWKTRRVFANACWALIKVRGNGSITNHLSIRWMNNKVQQCCTSAKPHKIVQHFQHKQKPSRVWTNTIQRGLHILEERTYSTHTHQINLITCFLIQIFIYLQWPNIDLLCFECLLYGDIDITWVVLSYQIFQWVIPCCLCTQFFSYFLRCFYYFISKYLFVPLFVSRALLVECVARRATVRQSHELLHLKKYFQKNKTIAILHVIAKTTHNLLFFFLSHLNGIVFFPEAF